MDRRKCILAAAALVVSLSAFANPPSIRPGAVAMKGYDPVAYFTDARARKGVDTIAHEFDGLQYRFATVRHRDLFIADPIRYLPQYAANCAVSLAGGVKYEADPERWVITDGKLYLFGNASARDRFKLDPAAYAKAANQNWRAGGASR